MKECSGLYLFNPTFLLLLKKVGSARLKESDLMDHFGPYQSKDPSPSILSYQPIDRKKRKGKREEDYSSYWNCHGTDRAMTFGPAYVRNFGALIWV